MLDQPPESACRDGLLSDRELDKIVASYVGKPSAAALDELAREQLARRHAVTEWELAESARGLDCLTFMAHRLCGRVTLGNIYDVLMAQHLFLGRVDIVKILRRDKLDVLPGLVAMHLRRSRAQSSVQSPYMVSVHEAGYHRDVHFVLVERVRGYDLLATISGHGPISMGAAAEIGMQVALGLVDLHSCGYVHGTLRPSKVLISESGSIKLADAGIARTPGRFNWDEDSFQLYADYLAPELIRDKELSFSTDMYLLGCLLYFSVTGQAPFIDGSVKDKARAHCESFPTSANLIRSDLDDEFIRLITQMIAKRPDERPQSASELAKQLSAFTSK